MFGGITFWTEGGRFTGMGHLARSVAIARALDARKVPVNFVVNNADAAVTALLDNASLAYALGDIDTFDPAQETGPVVVVDSKKDFSLLAGSLRARGKSVVAMDNIICNEYCDSVIIPSASFSPEQWLEDGGGLPARGADAIYGGSDYVIAGKNFLERRAEERDFTGVPLKVLVTMGGSDPNGLSGFITKALLGLKGVEVCVVIGPAAKISESMRAIMDSAPENLSFLTGVKDLAPLAARAQLVFTALGITVYELASIGTPSILIGNYKSDVEEMGRLESRGICRSLGFFKDVTEGAVANIVQFFSEQRGELTVMGKKAKALVDGRGAQRVAGILEALLAAPTIEKLNGTVHA